MKTITKLLSSTAFMMGLDVVVSMLTNKYIKGIYQDFLADNS